MSMIGRWAASASAALFLTGLVALPLANGSVSALLGLSLAAAHGDRDHDLAKRLKDAGDIQPLETLLARAKAEHHGRVLEAELKKRAEQYVYEIELLDEQGVVWRLYYDARTGELLSTTEDK